MRLKGKWGDGDSSISNLYIPNLEHIPGMEPCAKLYVLKHKLNNNQVLVAAT